MSARSWNVSPSLAKVAVFQFWQLLIRQSRRGKAINSFTGSLAFAAESRLCFITVEDTGFDRLLMLAVKNNIGGKADGIGYRFKPGTTSQGIEGCRIEWDQEPVIVSANEALAEVASEPKR